MAYDCGTSIPLGGLWGAMDYLAILNQVAAVSAGVDGIKTGFAPVDYPGSLNREDLPASVPFLAPGSRDVDADSSGRASCRVLESQDIINRIYLVAAAQGYDIGDLVEYSVPFLGLLLAAFDARPLLVNADGSNPRDFDARAVGLQRAFIKTHKGVTVQLYGSVPYFTIDTTLTVDGWSITAKVKGN